MRHQGRYGLAFAVVATVLAVVVPQSPALAEQSLGQAAGVVDDTPNPSHYYSFVSRTNYWAVMGVLPPASADYDLEVTAPNGTKTYSTEGTGIADFVLVNGNAGCPGAATYQARVFRYSGSGDNRVAVDSGHVLQQGTAGNTVHLQAGFLTVYDVYMEAGARYAFLAPPLDPTKFAQLWIFGSLPSNPSTCTRTRSQALYHDGGHDWQISPVQVPYTGWYAAVFVAPDQEAAPIWFQRLS